MASLGAVDVSSADETLSVSAVTDIDLDSTGAGSPPPSTFGQTLDADFDHSKSVTMMPGPSAPAAVPIDPAAASYNPHASSSSLESALGETLVISGGSGYNDLVGATPGATYVMPISDNGGSSSEIIRVLGGPSIGDLRSRLNRLIPTPSRHFSSSPTSSPPSSNEAIHSLLSYRLPSTGSARSIKQEWMDILEGRHRLWRGIEPERKEVIRGFLVHFESEVLRRAHRHFNFRGGSIGNFFLAAAQKFFRSIQSAIFLFSATTQMNTTGIGGKVLPVINTNHTATIAAELEDGDLIVGQCEISHPAPKWREKRSQPPGTPSSAVFESFQHAAEGRGGVGAGLLGAEGAEGDAGPSTPGFGPPAHYEPFSSNYTSMSASMDVLKIATPENEMQRSLSVASGKFGAASTPARGTVGPSPLLAQLVDDRAAAYAAPARKGLTTVGNHKDGLDVDDDDHDSQDGGDQIDSPRYSSAAEDDAPHSSFKLSDSGLLRRKTARKEKTGNIIFSKAEDEACEPALPSRIRRILYVNAYRNEIYPAPNPSFVTALARSKTIVYSCGSLWTSIVPCLCLRSVATSIATSPTLEYKILLLNSVQDRETKGMDALDFVNAICTSLNESDVPAQEGKRSSEWKPSQLISHLVYFPDGQLKVDTHRLEALGIRCIATETRLRSKNGTPKFDEHSVRSALTHIITPAPL